MSKHTEEAKNKITISFQFDGRDFGASLLIEESERNFASVEHQLNCLINAALSTMVKQELIPSQDGCGACRFCSEEKQMACTKFQEST